MQRGYHRGIRPVISALEVHHVVDAFRVGTRHRRDFIPRHGPTGEVGLGNPEAVHEAAKVLGQCCGVVRFFRFGVAVPALSIGDNPETFGECRRKIVKDVRIVSLAMDQDNVGPDPPQSR